MFDIVAILCEQMMAAVRCKRSKWPFIISTLLGRRWEENDLFVPPDEVPIGPAAVLAQVLAHFVTILVYARPECVFRKDC